MARTFASFFLDRSYDVVRGFKVWRKHVSPGGSHLSQLRNTKTLTQAYRD